MYLFGSPILRTGARFHVFFVVFVCAILRYSGESFYFFNTGLIRWPHKPHQYHSICLLVLTHEQNETLRNNTASSREQDVAQY